MQLKSLFLAAALGAALTVSAQPRAVGLRLGVNSVEMSFQQLMNSESNLFELDFGTGWNFNSLQGAATYNWTSSTSSGEWTTYAGLGLGAGYTWGDNKWYSKDKTSYLSNYWTLGVAGLLGIEFKLPNLPIGISLDYRPLFGGDFGTHSGDGKFGVQFNTPGLYNFGISVRYLLM